MLRLAVSNTEEDLQYHKLCKQTEYFRCPRKKCHHKWKSTIGQMIENKTCPKCGGDC